MANALITVNCNRECTFCFARRRTNRAAESGSAANMSREDVRKIMDFQERSGQKSLRLLGGEPTMHPEFIEIVREALDRDFHVHIFTNGIMSKQKADFLGSIPKERVSILANISPQAADTERQIAMRRYALEALGNRVALGITVTQPEFEYEFLIEHIERYKLDKSIRLGIAQPIVGEANECLRPEEYHRVGAGIARMAEACIRHDIVLGFDCGMTLCMFSEEQHGKIATCTSGFRSVCDPIIDIGPNMDVWSCFPLSEVLNARLEKFANRSEIVSFYNSLLRPYRSLGCMPACLQCDFRRRGQCFGGCLAHAMNSLNKPPPKLAN